MFTFQDGVGKDAKVEGEIAELPAAFVRCNNASPILCPWLHICVASVTLRAESELLVAYHRHHYAVLRDDIHTARSKGTRV